MSSPTSATVKLNDYTFDGTYQTLQSTSYAKYSEAYNLTALAVNKSDQIALLRTVGSGSGAITVLDLYGADNHPIRSSEPVFTGDTATVAGERLFALADGRFLAVWGIGHPVHTGTVVTSYDRYDFYGHVFDATGHAVGAQLDLFTYSATLATNEDLSVRAQIATLQDGGFATEFQVVRSSLSGQNFIETYPDATLSVWHEATGGDGFRATSSTSLDTAATKQRLGDLLTLPDGRILQTWTETNADLSGDVKGQFLSSAGIVVDGPFVIHHYAAVDKFDSYDVTLLSNGNLVFDWEEFGFTAGIPSTQYAQIFRPDYSSNLGIYLGNIVHQASTAGGQVYALYAGLLGRAPDVLGLEYWADQFEHGVSVRDLGQLLLSSAEGQARAGGLGSSEFVSQLYQSTLGRLADSGGLAYWTDQLDNHGAQRIDVASGFVFSAEHLSSLQSVFDAGLFVPDKQAADVARLYYTMLGRAPDAGGLQYWADQLEHGGTISDLAKVFLGTPENVSKYGSMGSFGYVDALYVNALGRHADADGQAYWEDLLEHGTSRADLAVLLSESAEAHSVHLSQIEQGWHLT
ncbi:DUF4214 domain-containing protein [Methylobacterium oxalidis]|uniref:DUF4214 domain-containing protein n=1 Tax=Methylobacterium oxalidis TaxID=944322 RepID=A0A512JB58_9HYPH|nr:DUF4214 domain-containing protein [Methylobacterium oxalidis]GEP07192.1 hypothetical protein MOX02_52300 [Methylobacterium oxalidis]GJE31485.1 hypothetical protein LDDCCGHA_1664 [Methylobacterium oxalidis]GLS65796.1 hypothetical protein GCM10007888_41780 [Methylobacterium oxalidis]